MPPVTVTIWPTFKPSVFAVTLKVLEPAVSVGALKVCAAVGAKANGSAVDALTMLFESVATPVPGL